MDYHELELNFRYSSSLQVRYHWKFHAQSTVTVIFEETQEQDPNIILVEVKRFGNVQEQFSCQTINHYY